MPTDTFNNLVSPDRPERKGDRYYPPTQRPYYPPPQPYYPSAGAAPPTHRRLYYAPPARSWYRTPQQDSVLYPSARLYPARGGSTLYRGGTTLYRQQAYYNQAALLAQRRQAQALVQQRQAALAAQQARADLLAARRAQQALVAGRASGLYAQPPPLHPVYPQAPVRKVSSLVNIQDMTL